MDELPKDVADGSAEDLPEVATPTPTGPIRASYQAKVHFHGPSDVNDQFAVPTVATVEAAIKSLLETAFPYFTLTVSAERID